MAIHWTIPFASLRDGTIYSVNIYDASYSGSPVQLKGGAQPFVTQEDDDEDFFADIRTQSGSIRIIDDGTFDWKALVPTTDTDRPVTLTHVVNGSTVLDWQGFMQAQNFGSTLFGNPQEREFPVQCALTVLEGSDIDTSWVEIVNFAFVIRECLNEIDRLSGGTISNHTVQTNGVVHISSIYVQGGADVKTWLLKRVDFQNYISLIGDHASANYNLFQILQDICRFWGWTARTYRNMLFLTRADDTVSPSFAVFTRSQLDSFIAGTDSSTSVNFNSVTLNGNEFASTNNEDYRQRGHNKAIVKADGNGADHSNMIELDEKVIEMMEDQGWSSESYQDDDYVVNYTNDLLQFTRPTVYGLCRSGYGAFALGRLTAILDGDYDTMSMIRIKKSYNASDTAINPCVRLTTIYHHLYADGYFILHGTTYRRTKKLEEVANPLIDPGRYHTWMRLGVGNTIGTAKWFNGTTWETGSGVYFRCTIGNTGDILWAVNASGHFYKKEIPAPNAEGMLIVEFLGSDDLDPIDGERSFELVNFSIEYYRNPYNIVAPGVAEKIDLPSEMEYSSQNGSNVRDEWSADCIYASDNDMAFGYGVLINPDGTFMHKTTYGSTEQFPEQNLADRVTAYWTTARRKVYLELCDNISQVQSINPYRKVTFDDMTFYPFAIGYDWRDDVKKVTMLELPT